MVRLLQGAEKSRPMLAKEEKRLGTGTPEGGYRGGVTGTENQKRVPPLSEVSNSRSEPMALTRRLAIERPTPLPEKKK